MMWLRPYRFQVPGTPVIGTTTLLSVDDGMVDWTSKTFAGTHTSASGNLCLLMATRSNNGFDGHVTGVTWNSSALTQSVEARISGVGRGIVWGGYINGGSTGAQDLVITLSDDARDFIGWIFDVDRAIAIGAAPTPTVTHVVKSSESINITPTDANSLLVGMVTAYDENINPMSVNSGWTEIDNQKTGNGGSSDIAAIFASRVSGTLSAKTLTGVSDAVATTDDWAALALELLPA